MSIDLKPYFDHARSADEDKQRILNEMNAAFNDGTEEGKAKALELRPSLDEATNKALAANELYLSLRGASQQNSAADQFVPVAPEAGKTSVEDGQSAAAKEMKRDDFIALDADSRMKFMKAGGKVTE
jgi:hypothetical protein